VKGIGLLILALCISTSCACADERDDEIAALKSQVQELSKRIEALEQGQKASSQIPPPPQTITKQPEAAVTMEKLASRLELKGRLVTGYFDSGKAGSYPAGSFEAPDAKLQLSFKPDDINKAVLRFNLNNGSFNSVDYAYLDTNLEKLLGLSFPLRSRMGRIRLDFGEEVVYNNAVEGVLPSNSASNVDGKDEGLQVSGKIGKAKPLSYVLSVTNGNSGTGSDTSSAKSFTGKLSYNILDPLSVSASYFNSGSMKSSSAEMTIGGLSARPSNALRWSREIWEVDLRYDFRKGKNFDPPAFSDSKAILRFAYGGFSDDVSSGAAVSTERSGQFGFLEGMYNLTKRFYVAGRFSVIDLDSDTTASLNNISCNEYQRYSLGMGYRLTQNVLLKLSYDWNKESGAGVDDADNDLLSAIVASQF